MNSEILNAKRLPPYAREVVEGMRAGGNPNVRLYANRPDPWSMARQHRYTFGPASTMVLPVDEEPEAFRWPPLGGLIANITGLDGELVRRLGACLIGSGVRVAYLLDADHAERGIRAVAGGAP